MSTTHFIVYFACGKHILAQCRCPGINSPKQERTSDIPCELCADVERTAREISAARGH